MLKVYSYVLEKAGRQNAFLHVLTCETTHTYT